MASERGAANIRRFNAEREQKTGVLIEQELRLCRRRKLDFRSVGLLAGYLSDRTRVHRTTLLRNAKYRIMLTLHIAAQQGAAAIVADDTDDPHVLRAKLASAQAEVGNLRHEIKRLTAQQVRLTDPSGRSTAGVDGPEFANLCVLLCLVLRRGEVFAIDTQDRSIVDLAARPSDRVVGSADRARAFVSWMERNAELPFVNSVRKISA